MFVENLINDHPELRDKLYRVHSRIYNMEKCSRCGNKGSPYYLRKLLKSGDVVYYQYVRHVRINELKDSLNLGTTIHKTCSTGIKLTKDEYSKVRPDKKDIDSIITQDDREQLLKLEKRMISSRSKTTAILIRKIIDSIPET